MQNVTPTAFIKETLATGLSVMLVFGIGMETMFRGVLKEENTLANGM